MSKTEIVKAHCKQLRLSVIANQLEEIVMDAQSNKVSYLDFAQSLFKQEVDHRMQKDRERRTKHAGLPLLHDLDRYNYSFENGMSKQQLAQLRELNWLEQNFNIILMGPSGVSKTYIAAGLCFDAIKQGYKAYFKTMEDLVGVLRLKDVTRTAGAEYKRIMKAHLLVIDDIMIFPINQQDAVAFFNLINELHDKASLIVTTNKSPKQWADVLKDTVLTTAILDRILYRCEVVNLEADSYRLLYRKTIFSENEKIN
jgi:DNA replication protein DnaC